RGSVGDGGQHQNSAFTEQTPPVIVRELHAPEFVSSHVRNSVMLCHTLVDECVVRGEQLKDISVFADDAIEEQLRLAFQAQGQCVVVKRIIKSVRMEVLQIRQMQPLAREFDCQGFRTRIMEHAPYLLLQYERILESPLTGKTDQFVVRKRAPK